MPETTLNEVPPLVTGVVVAVPPSATVVPTNDPPTATSGCDESGGELTLITIFEKLKAEVGIEGTVIEVVEIATMKLGADPTGSLSLVQRARACHFIAFGWPPEEASSKSTAADVPMRPPQHQIETPVAAFGAMGTAVVTVQPGAAALIKSAPGARVVLLGKDEGCSCLPGRCKGFDETLRSKPCFVAVPDELAARGVTPAEWRAKMEKLAAVQAKNGDFDCCRCAILLLCLPFIPPSPLWCACMCLPWSKWDPFQIAMHEWLGAINRDLLRPKGMYAKAFCFKQTGQSGEFKKEGTLATINIALTPHDVSRLEAQPVFQQPHPLDPCAPACLFWCLPAHAGRAV